MVHLNGHCCIVLLTVTNFETVFTTIHHNSVHYFDHSTANRLMKEAIDIDMFLCFKLPVYLSIKPVFAWAYIYCILKNNAKD